MALYFHINCTFYTHYKFVSNIVSPQWNMVCDQRSLKEMSQTVYMGGVLVGAVIFGTLSDR